MEQINRIRGKVKNQAAIVEYGGKNYTIKELAEKFNIDKGTLRSRIKHGWDLEKALIMPLGPSETLITYNGKTQNLKDWSIESNIKYEVLVNRISTYKWPLDKAFGAPLIRKIEFNGESLTLSEWSIKLNIPITTISSRFKNGWSIEDAFTKPIRNKSPKDK